MLPWKSYWQCLTVVFGCLLGGCAPAYHSYSGCTVDCKYCVPPPLAYTHYSDCVCHSCAASRHLNPSQPLISPAGLESTPEDPAVNDPAVNDPTVNDPTVNDPTAGESR